MLMDVVYNTITITGSPSLRELDVGGNEIGDIGVELLCKELHNNNHLTSLNVGECGLSVKGICDRICERGLIAVLNC